VSEIRSRVSTVVLKGRTKSVIGRGRELELKLLDEVGDPICKRLAVSGITEDGRDRGGEIMSVSGSSTSKVEVR
jgi:hypothetical protein